MLNSKLARIVGIVIGLVVGGGGSLHYAQVRQDLGTARAELGSAKKALVTKDATIGDREHRIEGLRASLDNVFANARNPAYTGILRTLSGLPALCQEFNDSPFVPAVCTQFATSEWADQVRKDGLSADPSKLLHRLQAMVIDACVPIRKSGRDWDQMPKVCSLQS